MTLAEMVAAMTSAGCTAEQICAAVQKLDEERRAKSRDGNRQRQAKFRASHNASNAVTGRDTALSGVTGRDGGLPDKESPHTPKEINPPHQSSLRSDSSAEVADLFLVAEPIAKPKAAIAERKRELKEFGESWNDLAAQHRLPTIDFIAPGSARERHALTTLRWLRQAYDAGPDALIAKIRGSPYLLGQVNDFKATFDWVCGASNRQKIWDGNYADRKQKPGPEQFRAPHIVSRGF